MLSSQKRRIIVLRDDRNSEIQLFSHQMQISMFFAEAEESIECCLETVINPQQQQQQQQLVN